MTYQYTKEQARADMDAVIIAIPMGDHKLALTHSLRLSAIEDMAASLERSKK